MLHNKKYKNILLLLLLSFLDYTFKYNFYHYLKQILVELHAQGSKSVSKIETGSESKRKFEYEWIGGYDNRDLLLTRLMKCFTAGSNDVILLPPIFLDTNKRKKIDDQELLQQFSFEEIHDHLVQNYHGFGKSLYFTYLLTYLL